MSTSDQGLPFVNVVTDKGVMKVSLLLHDVGQPTIALRSGNGTGPRHTYWLSQFMECRSRKQAFSIALGDGEFGALPIETIPADEVVKITEMALGMLSPLMGTYELKWVPFDPELPF
jgi:hypothetical protein